MYNFINNLNLNITKKINVNTFRFLFQYEELTSNTSKLIFNFQLQINSQFFMILTNIIKNQMLTKKIIIFMTKHFKYL